MISAAALISAGIPLSGTDGTDILKATAALEWIRDNTTLEVDLEDPASIEKLPATAKLFVSKYVEVLSLKEGVSSQSIEGLSMSFNTADKSAMLWQLASTLLGKYLRQVRFTPAKRRW
jgi:TusA-related sulfurtransferase